MTCLLVWGRSFCICVGSHSGSVEAQSVATYEFFSQHLGGARDLVLGRCTWSVGDASLVGCAESTYG